MSKRSIEFEANEDHDWLFHCHILYHMMSGMARVFRYEQPEGATTETEAEMKIAADPDNSKHNVALGEHSHDPDQHERRVADLDEPQKRPPPVLGDRLGTRR